MRFCTAKYRDQKKRQFEVVNFELQMKLQPKAGEQAVKVAS
jgi:hypothetical protein